MFLPVTAAASSIFIAGSAGDAVGLYGAAAVLIVVGVCTAALAVWSGVKGNKAGAGVAVLLFASVAVVAAALSNGHVGNRWPVWAYLAVLVFVVVWCGTVALAFWAGSERSMPGLVGTMLLSAALVLTGAGFAQWADNALQSARPPQSSKVAD
jgi:peptidoglycan/LPS O-acetylase OafA/YrhL